MTHQLSDQDQTRMALAALTACVVQSLKLNGVIRSADFEKSLEVAYGDIRDMGLDTLGALQTLSWTREILKKF